MSRGAVIVPARYRSSRFPGKPLAEINGITMIQRVYLRCAEAVGAENVYVATDDQRIASEITRNGGNAILTSGDHLTGTDRVAEAANRLSLDFVVNVQGDEPFVRPDDIRLIFGEMALNQGRVVNCYCKIQDEEVEKPTVPKVVVSPNNTLLYMSRGGVPFGKNGRSAAKFKQICIYGYSAEHLRAFTDKKEKSPLETIEDIEILRFLEMGYLIKMIEVEAGTIAVDTFEDLVLARHFAVVEG